MSDDAKTKLISFQPTLPSRGATSGALPAACSSHYFNPRSPRGERRTSREKITIDGVTFQPTLPSRGATQPCPRPHDRRRISTHAPLAGSDPCGWRAGVCTDLTISTHAPLAGSDDLRQARHAGKQRFQPTLPSRGATRTQCASLAFSERFQPTLPSRGATPPSTAISSTSLRFQPTLPSRGATLPISNPISPPNFNPRSPRGERRNCQHAAGGRGAISTHAPLAGSDGRRRRGQRGRRYFNPRSPRGERLQKFTDPPSQILAKALMVPNGFCKNFHIAL